MSKFIKRQKNQPPSPVIQKFASWEGTPLIKAEVRASSGEKQRTQHRAYPRRHLKKQTSDVELTQSVNRTPKKPPRPPVKLRQQTQILDNRAIIRQSSQMQIRTHYSPIYSSIGEYQIEERFQQIQQLYHQENQNLKQQKQYLMDVIANMQKKQKQYKNQIREYKQANDELYFENSILKKKYEQAREFISNGIGMIQQAVNSSNVVNVNSGQNISSKNSVGAPLLQSPHADTTTSMNFTDAIEELSDKFDALMFQYQKNRSPEIRKQCMGIAKEIKKLKKKNGISSHSHNNKNQ